MSGRVRTEPWRGPVMGPVMGLVIGLTLLAAAPAWGQASPEPSDQEPPAEASEPEPRGSDLPGLDEQLGLEDEPGAGAGEESSGLADPARAELDRQLTMEQAAEQFKEAVDLMGETAERLSVRETGLPTQRLQEDILRKLDRMIEAAQRQQGSSSSKSRSQSQQQQQQQQQPNQQPRPSREQAQDPSQGDNQGEVEPPGGRGGELRPELAPTRAAWGALPARVRDALLQGSSDSFSSLYEGMTEAYYRTLAEEAGR